MDGSDGEGFKRGRQERIDIRVGVERRRRWSRDDRLRIVQETLADGAVIADVARRNEVASSLIYTWRKQALAGLLGGFHQVRIVPEIGPEIASGIALATALAAPQPASAQGVPVTSVANAPTPTHSLARGRIELTLRDGTVLRVDDDGEQGALKTILASLDHRS
jgi:transposase